MFTSNSFTCEVLGSPTCVVLESGCRRANKIRLISVAMHCLLIYVLQCFPIDGYYTYARVRWMRSDILNMICSWTGTSDIIRTSSVQVGQPLYTVTVCFPKDGLDIIIPMLYDEARLSMVCSCTGTSDIRRPSSAQVGQHVYPVYVHCTDMLPQGS